MSCLRRGLTAHALAAQGSAGWLKVLIGFGTFCWVTVASVGLGLLSGALSAIITRWWWIRGVVHAEILVLAALPYMTYVGAEALDVSGIMSLFVCGMMVRQTTPPLPVRQSLDQSLVTRMRITTKPPPSPGLTKTSIGHTCHTVL